MRRIPSNRVASVVSNRVSNLATLFVGLACSVLITACGAKSKHNSGSDVKVATPTTGNVYLDQNIYGLANVMNAYFGTNTTLVMDNDPVFNALSHPDGHVQLYYPMINAGIDGPYSWPFLALVMAHEWAHQLQFQDYGSQMQFTIQKELQADCVGAYVLFTYWNVNLPEILTTLSNKVSQISDPAGTPWYAPSAHGSAEQRVAAVQRGATLRAQGAQLGQLYGPWQVYQACHY